MNPKRIKLILAIVIALLLANLAYTFFGVHSRLNKAIRDIEHTRDTINKAIPA